MDKNQKPKIPEKGINPLDDYTKEIIRYYVMLDKGNTEDEVCKSIWQYYCRLNSERIWASENQEKISVFDALVEKHKEELTNYNIYSLFYDILTVETGLSKEDKKYKNSMKALSKALKREKLSSVMTLKELLNQKKQGMVKTVSTNKANT